MMKSNTLFLFWLIKTASCWSHLCVHLLPRAECSLLGGRLASIHSRQENDFVSRLMRAEKPGMEGARYSPHNHHLKSFVHSNHWTGSAQFQVLFTFTHSLECIPLKYQSGIVLSGPGTSSMAVLWLSQSEIEWPADMGLFEWKVTSRANPVLNELTTHSTINPTRSVLLCQPGVGTPDPGPRLSQYVKVPGSLCLGPDGL